jgi:hypothetical protein
MNTKFALVVLAAALSGCVDAPLPRPAQPAPQPVNLTKVYFYPTQGQSAEQQERDRYDCHVWAVKQTGFDPTQHIAPREARAEVVPARSPDATVGTAAVVGAVLGAAIAGPGDAGKGAVVGAMAGAVAGSAAAASDQAEADAANAAAARRDARGSGRYQQEASDYRRAMSACLTGRGYSVR